MTPPDDGRVALIIGGSRGIGLAIARELADEGWRVTLAARAPEQLSAAMASLAGGRRHLTVSMDVTQEDSVRAGVQQVLDNHGRIDMLVTSIAPGNAAGLPPPFARLSLAQWQGVLDSQLTGVYLANRAVLSAMRRHGHGTIVNIGSALTPRGMRGRAYAPAYSAAKYAVAAFGEALAEEVRDFGIRVLTLFPGPVSTPLIADTALARDFGGAMCPESFASVTVRLATLPDDVLAPNTIIIPFRGGVRPPIRG